MKMDYISIPEDAYPNRNDKFYEEISHNWQKKAKDLQKRRWGKLDN